MFSIFNKRGAGLRSALISEKKIKIDGIRLTIRKINNLDFLDGSKVLHKTFQTYEDKRLSGKPIDNDKLNKILKDHYRDVFLSGVISPKLIRKQDDSSEAIYVDELFDNMEFAQKLYQSIFIHTYGKKKVLSALKTLKRSQGLES